MNFGVPSKPQLTILNASPGLCSEFPEIIPITLIDFSNSTIPKVLSSLEDHSSNIPGSFTGLVFSSPKQLLQYWLGGQLVLLHFMHSPTTNLPCFSSDSKLNLLAPKQLMMLQLLTCSAQGRLLLFLPVFFLHFLEAELLSLQFEQFLLLQVDGPHQSILHVD